MQSVVSSYNETQLVSISHAVSETKLFTISLETDNCCLLMLSSSDEESFTLHFLSDMTLIDSK